jgi:DNA polymerase
MSRSNPYNRKCQLCPLHENEGYTCISGAGNIKNPRVLVVGDGPSKNEAENKRAFTDQRGQLLQEALAEVGIPTGSDGAVFATYVCKCFPHGKIKPKDAKVCAATYLEQEILKYKPELIIALGKTAQTAVLHKPAPISKTHGKLFDATFEVDEEVFETKVMPVEHPFSILQSPSKIDPWLADLRRAKMVLYAEGEPYWTPDKAERFTFELIDSTRKLKQMANTIISGYRGEYLGLDIEASGLDDIMYFDKYKVYTLQLGVVDLTDPEYNDRLPVYIIPLQSSQFSICKNPMWLDSAAGLLNHLLSPRYFKLIAHNGKYDLKGLRRIGVHTPYLWWDTMLLWANTHGEAPMSLKEIAYQVTDLGGYEKKMEEYFKEHGTYDAPPEILMEYGGLDVVVTRHLMYEMNQTTLQETTK